MHLIKAKFCRPCLNLGQFSMKMKLAKQLEPNLNIRVRELQRKAVEGGRKRMKFPELCRLPPFTLWWFYSIIPYTSLSLNTNYCQWLIKLNSMQISRNHRIQSQTTHRHYQHTHTKNDVISLPPPSSATSFTRHRNLKILNGDLNWMHCGTPIVRC